MLAQVGEKNRHRFRISMEIADRPAYHGYNEHPDHVRFVHGALATEVSEFLELDYAALQAPRRDVLRARRESRLTEKPKPSAPGFVVLRHVGDDTWQLLGEVPRRARPARACGPHAGDPRRDQR